MTATAKLSTFGLLAATLALALSSVACGPVVPVSPTWKDDVRPLMVSRCIRCHSDPFRTDPSAPATLPVPTGAVASAFNFDYVTFEEIPPGNRAFLQMAGQYCRMKGPLFMPPPPAEALEDWQLETLDAWAFNPQ